MSLVTFHQVSYKKVLNDLSFSVPSGGIIGLAGTNGSGKSTLLHLLAGLIRPDQGAIMLGGERINHQSRRQIAFSPEREWLYSFHTVGQTVELAASVYPDFNLSKADQLLQQFQLTLDSIVGKLSKGNRARLQAILTLCRTVPLLIMDEPLSGLDPATRDQLLRMMVEHTELERQSIIVATHEIAELEIYLDHVLVLKEGKLVLSGNVEDLRETKGLSLLEVLKEVLL